MKKTINKILKTLGYEITSVNTKTQSMEKDFLKKYELCKDYTMTDVHRMYATYQAVRYCIINNIQGSFVECGVWKGGHTMMMALKLKATKQNRYIWLYDTFEGMSEPTKHDVYRNKVIAKNKYLQTNKGETTNWCYSPIEEVENNMKKTGYSDKRIMYIKGDVARTLKKWTPSKIALLRLDTDFYESTKAELETLYPKLSKGGVLLIDDYDAWQGSRKAVDEYFLKHNIKPLLHLTGNGGRIMIK